MPPKTNKTSLTKAKPWQYILLGFLVLLFGVSILGVMHTTAIKDWYILHTYKPPATVAQLTETDGFTAYARKLFLINKPHLDNKTAFASSCPNDIDQSYVLGCYHSGDNGIFLLNVQDVQLNGIVPVTAAYEMLHSGYDRLSSSTRNLIDNQMWSFYQSSVTSSEIKQQMAAYASSEPGARYDELYSVLATEVNVLPAYLENHYKLYFKDRSTIVAQYDHYEVAFSSRQQLLASDDQELNSLKQQIDQSDNQLSAELNAINQQMQTLNYERSIGNNDAYNSGVPAYNSEVDSYNQQVMTTRAEIDEYNALVTQRNSLVLEEQQLIQAISTSPSPKTP